MKLQCIITIITIANVQCLLIIKAQAGKTVNRKQFLGEHERTINGFRAARC
ncbi:MAG: hypothetical protein FWC60_12490 [Firmicutes bacterium]|nr:hypothetical protein [Bacillota bacterium]